MLCFFAEGAHVGHRPSSDPQSLHLPLRIIHKNGIIRRDGQQRLLFCTIIRFLLLVNWDQRMRVERFMRQVIIDWNVLTLRRGDFLLFLCFFELHRDAFRSNADLLTLDTYYFDGVAETSDLIFHLGYLSGLAADYGFEEGCFGVELDIGQFAYLQQG